MNSCDNCFATVDEESRVATVSSKDGVKFMACAGCKVVHYCSKVGSLHLSVR